MTVWSVLPPVTTAAALTVCAPGGRFVPASFTPSCSLWPYSVPSVVLKLTLDVACHVALLVIFALKLRRFVCVSLMRPWRRVPEFGHSAKRQTPTNTLLARSTPAVAWLVIQANGRQVASAEPMNRCVPFVL